MQSARVDEIRIAVHRSSRTASARGPIGPKRAEKGRSSLADESEEAREMQVRSKRERSADGLVHQQ